ncbi:cbb3-type cytochrome oxidase assembly protein CcoS [Sulfitobacter sp. SK012]|uniref:cbb3-type cytochrome oxidase assembly protein CcoS n=1 Tax=Sulfitobacter sp. SK012 TaxID=1389005 RepID=UPI000E0B2F05|nr:cbb3-type cytochrome oxidase assembly protein CcoS [Sulfitobacter sp. SK012]AXI48726.1 cbb3-type cytochrome oxidase assembly protein CcoS [Sulfitobacter sp. SK012]
MNVLVVLIPVSLVLGAVGLIAFLWTVRSDQYDDALGNAARILLDDDNNKPADSEN